MRQRCQKFVLPLVRTSHQVLALACAYRCASGSNQRDGAHRALQQGDITQLLDRSLHVQRIRPAASQEKYRQVRPGWLGSDIADQCRHGMTADCFFDQQQHADPSLHL